KVGGAERDERKRIITRICDRFDAELVQAIGHIALIYRKHPD
ncbi:MAG: YhbY family RNA-binding protein, partial [Gammaproteobacteria bacterium]|nr:YhbY family RNA-binding protein [Gammaproteobacteria bacterium]